MPEWIHSRAEHLLAKNPSMPKSMAFAVATQQAHATGHAPKGYGTSKGKSTAKAKFDTPKNDEQRANPGHLDSPKLASRVSLKLLKLSEAGAGFELPEDHVPGMRVSKGGSSCATCKYASVQEDGPHCTNQYYQQWAGTSELIDIKTGERVLNADEYCSDWWEPAEEASVEKSASVGEVVLGILKHAGLISAVKGLPGAVSAMPAAKRTALNEIGGLGVLAVPGLDTMQSKLRARMAGDKTNEGAEKRRFLGEGAHAALDVGGLGMLMAPEFAHLKHAFIASAFGGNVAQNPPGMRGRSQIPTFSPPPLAVKQAGVGVGAGMSTSQYSGRLSDGSFKMTSGIPAFKRPEMVRDDASGSPEPWMFGGNKTAASMNTATDAMSPAGKLNVTQRVGSPKTTGFAGPSIADISKPKGFGKPLAGAQKNQL